MDFEVLINKTHLLDKDYIPDDLVITDNNENNFHKYDDASLKPCISQSILPYFEKMQQDMKKDNLFIIIDSGYRSYDYQKRIFDYYVKKNGLEQTEKKVAIPGASEHQSGLAIDIALIQNGVYNDDVKETDKEVKWLMNNAYKYGFILRYPKGKEDITSYQFEPWHFRYVGTRLSYLLNKFNITLDEYYDNKKYYDGE